MEEQQNIQTETEVVQEEVTAPKKSKKLLLIGVIAVAVLALIVAAVILIPRLLMHPIERLADKIERSDNMEIEIVLSYTGYDRSYVIAMKRDGNLTYVSSIVSGEAEKEYYLETKGNITYQYLNNGTKWVKTIYEDNYDFDQSTTNELLALLDPDNYDEIRGKRKTYRQKNTVEFDTFEDVVLTIDGNEMFIEASADSYLNFSISIFNIGKTKVKLP